jgi:hypothetical protein
VRALAQMIVERFGFRSPFLRRASLCVGLAVVTAAAAMVFAIVQSGEIRVGARRYAPTPVIKPEAREIVFNLFSDQGGARLARLRIERMSVESGREGFMRIGLRPVVVFDGVDLQIESTTLWPEAGRKIRDALERTAGGEFVLRNVRLQNTDATPRRVFAPSGRLRSEGAIELVHARDIETARSAEPVTLWFWLTGPQAARFAAPPANAPSAPLQRKPFPAPISARLD